MITCQLLEPDTLTLFLVSHGRGDYWYGNEVWYGMMRYEEYSPCPCSYDRVLQCCAFWSPQHWGRNSSKRTGLLGRHFKGFFNLSQQTAVMPAGETLSRSWGNWLCRTDDTWQCQEEHTALRGVRPKVSATGRQNLLHKLSVYSPYWSISNLQPKITTFFFWFHF